MYMAQFVIRNPEKEAQKLELQVFLSAAAAH